MSAVVPEGERDAPAEPWFRRWFGEDYLELYPHRDESEAGRAVELFVRSVPAEARDPVLDLACGAGRHLRTLSVEGVSAVGLDLSLPLLRRARAGTAQEAHVAPVVRGDMRRLPFADGAFGAVCSFFTSFGYFPSTDEDRAVVRQVRRVLRPDGWFLLDFLNARTVRRELVPRDEKRVGGRLVTQERRLVEGERVVEKRIRIEAEDGKGPSREFRERVRLYTADELTTLLEEEGFRPEARFGDYDGAALAKGAPRVIILARVPPSRPDRAGTPSTDDRTNR